jgi:hypothetical protein
VIGVRFPDLCRQRTMFRLVLRYVHPETEMYVKFYPGLCSARTEKETCELHASEKWFEVKSEGGT